MRTRPSLLQLLVPAVLAAGCQTYDFEPVEPFALSQTTVADTIVSRASVPNLMLLVDTSGSMSDPVSPGSGTTRWTALKRAMGSFLSANGDIARFALATYPTEANDFCGPSTSMRKALPEVEEANLLKEHALQVNQELQAITRVEGGTPTADSLRYVGSLVGLHTQEREDFVLLLTDGLPNCNYNNPNSGPSPACRCTFGSASECSGTNARRGCLDDQNSIAAVQDLRTRGIRTIVVGFGADTATGDAPEVLNAMAEAGGFARRCQGDGDCGAGDTCEASAGLCRRRYYQASNGAELATALEKISSGINPQPCVIRIPPEQIPSSEAMVVVYVKGERMVAGEDTWRLKAGVGVELKGSLCERASRATPADPLPVEVRALLSR
jgi:hypothetical protein